LIALSDPVVAKNATTEDFSVVQKEGERHVQCTMPIMILME